MEHSAIIFSVGPCGAWRPWGIAMRGCSVERQGCACTNATREAGVAASVHTVTANVIPENPRKLEVMEQKLLLSDTTGFLVGIDWGFEIHGNLEPCLKQPGDVSLATCRHQRHNSHRKQPSLNPRRPRHRMQVSPPASARFSRILWHPGGRARTRATGTVEALEEAAAG